MLFVWAPTYLRESRGFAYSAELNVLSMLVWAAATLGAGALADRIRSLPCVTLAGVLATGTLAPLVFFVMDQLPVEGCAPLFMLLVICHGCYVGPIQAWFVLSLRRVSTRYAGLGLAYNLCAALLAGTTPLVAHVLSASALGAVGAGGYLSLAALLSGLTVWLAERYAPLQTTTNDHTCNTMMSDIASKSDELQHNGTEHAPQCGLFGEDEGSMMQSRF